MGSSKERLPGIGLAWISDWSIFDHEHDSLGSFFPKLILSPFYTYGILWHGSCEKFWRGFSDIGDLQLVALLNSHKYLEHQQTRAQPNYLQRFAYEECYKILKDIQNESKWYNIQHQYPILFWSIFSFSPCAVDQWRQTCRRDTLWQWTSEASSAATFKGHNGEDLTRMLQVILTIPFFIHI